MKATVATLKKYKGVILAGIGIVLAMGIVILCGLLASCSSQADAGSINARDGVIAVLDDADALVGDVKDGIEADENEDPAIEEVEAAPSDDALARAQSAQTSGGSAPSDASSPTTSPSAATNTQASTPSAQSAPQKKWVEDTQQVWVEDRAAWSESVPVYGTNEVSICNVCGADITGNTAAHGKAHMLAGEGSGHHSEVRKVVTGYNTVNHPAEGHYETRAVGGHWE